MKDVVRIKGLRKTYGGVAAVDGVDISVPPGEVFGLLGPNGAGKSTTIECALGTRKRDAGTVTLLDRDPVKERAALFERVGVQFQESAFPDRTRVGELCRLYAALYKRPADPAGIVSSLGLETKWRTPVSELSGGEKQRLAVALALIPDPELLFLDELTTGLDPRARREVWALITALKARGVTIFLSSHYMDEVEALCDRIAIMREGRIIAEGTPGRLKASTGAQSLEEAFLRSIEAETTREVEVC